MTKIFLVPQDDPEPKFPLGDVYITPAAQEALSLEEVAQSLLRHSKCDWGDAVDDDRRENEVALAEGYRLFSVYHTSTGTKFWIITEADRSSTTVLLPDDY